jgi:hypothetical protein
VFLWLTVANPRRVHLMLFDSFRHTVLSSRCFHRARGRLLLGCTHIPNIVEWSDVIIQVLIHMYDTQYTTQNAIRQLDQISAQTSFPTGPGFPGLPAAFQAAKTKSITSSTPSPLRTLVKTVGPSPRISFASLSMTSNEAPT